MSMNTRFMELELGLALPNHSSSTPMMLKGLDLNSCSNEEMEIEQRKKGDCNKYSHRNSTCVEEEEEVDSKTLSLLLWSGRQPNEDDDARKWRNYLHVNDEEINDEEIMGWPPINSLMRKELYGGGGRAVVRNSMYVKVKMEGVPIGRKIDLTLYNSYQPFTDSLINMFAKYIKNDSRSGGNYRILYQDKQGDWMLAGDHVPWERFVESVQRMEILRNAN
ncbi:hypothetical protein C2S52_002902 [Perilla frutescens var. hirtella]|nr:hypothetical protein C2S51_012550 [Perilla frutescens var. frutescens]KAH6792425.1 hypothetical protein C2S52_002902 [Perilla frutescens var. hirtella]